MHWHIFQAPSIQNLSTFSGKDEAARQMAAAYRSYLTPPTDMSWRYADKRQNVVGRSGDLGLMLSSIKRKHKKTD